MNSKIITSDSDIELDPESLMDSTDVLVDNKHKRLEAIRDLENLIDNINLNVTQDISEVKTPIKKIDCLIKFETSLQSNTFVTYLNLFSLSQTLVERNVTEVELTGNDHKLISLFSFYQNNVYKQKSSRLRKIKMIFSKKKTVGRQKKRKTFTKNDIIITSFYTKLNGKKTNLIDVSRYKWKVNEMKYTFDNNSSTIKILLVRTK